jgi:uncharacterized protein (TIGR02453 family)
MHAVSPDFFPFFTALGRNNKREWFQARKDRFDALQDNLRAVLEDLRAGLEKTDHLEEAKLFRIYRDARFSADKSPYKTYMGMSFKRRKPDLRGGYYLHLEPGGSFVGGGFWDPNPQDLKRIREELAADDAAFRKITADKTFRKYFGALEGESLKTAPAGFDRDHPAIDLIRMKQFLVRRSFTDDEVVQPGFPKDVLKTFGAMRPFFDYMSEVLSTNLNGERIIP